MELKDEGCQILSAQCLYGGEFRYVGASAEGCFPRLLTRVAAGLCVQDQMRREKIISMIEDCEMRTGWPMAPWRRDLREEWAKVDNDYSEVPA